jgi:hypothetical protein
LVTTSAATVKDDRPMTEARIDYVLAKIPLSRLVLEKEIAAFAARLASVRIRVQDGRCLRHVRRTAGCVKASSGTQQRRAGSPPF